ncbi:MAG: MerR family transcriptional regulator, partial [Lachnospiraceae bacterium]|nr:MerR family transcriptional regulator [Lachnospiraceae bacterium]
MSGTGELSRLFEIDRTTLNYYVKTGLIQAGTDSNQYHRYGFSDSMALAFIRYYRGLGFATEDIMCLLGDDTNPERLQRINTQIIDTKRQIRILQLKQWLLENLDTSFSFMEEHPSQPVLIMTEPYYFIYKKDMI